MAWHAVAKADDVQEGKVLAASAADKMIALYRIDGTFYATSDICTHAFALLSDGYLDGDCIECPIHQALFHVPTGEVRAEPATEPLRTFPVKVDGEMLMVEITD
ncbi:non-heme iron oxygenase ferredoxin subunit [Pseudolabrys taiwanensis]|uniref:Non-heme iron oxygenase ferredoxin subunit n=1 Tax=Pseudolabrys taiwanensis TaxID=331696 RepID=A0A345ZW26_9HYPH|nr:non-heme iron oxygenase ferredoxin subunit [Pseudolabrys taiwanensis]AXK81123.1 non-heme iron oxygenase ferredoxin subunit [Pseudolabrys taiwanensis]